MKLTRIAVASLFWLVGCAHIPEKVDPGITPPAFFEKQKLRREALPQVTSRILMTFENGKDSVTGRGQLASQLPGSFRLELRDPIGKLQFLLTLSGDRCVAQFPTKAQAFKDQKACAKYFAQQAGVAFSGEELQWLFLGLMPGLNESKQITSWHWDAYKGGYEASATTAKRNITFLVDGVSLLLKEFRVEEGKVKARFSDFRPTAEAQGASFAHRIVLEDERTRHSVEIDVKDISLVKSKLGPELFEPGPLTNVKVVGLD